MSGLMMRQGTERVDGNRILEKYKLLLNYLPYDNCL